MMLEWWWHFSMLLNALCALLLLKISCTCAGVSACLGHVLLFLCVSAGSGLPAVSCSFAYTWLMATHALCLVPDVASCRALLHYSDPAATGLQTQHCQGEIRCSNQSHLSLA